MGPAIRRRPVRFLAFLAMAVAAAIAPPAASHEYRLGAIEIVHPWARASGDGAENGAAYVELINRGGAPDRLIGASTPMSAGVELHRHASSNGIMHMEPVPAIGLPPGDHVVLQPGGLHVMLTGLAGPLVEGRSFPLTLAFEEAGSVEVSVTIAPAATMHSTHAAAAP
jgi:copper(I)-binding protein